MAGRHSMVREWLVGWAANVPWLKSRSGQPAVRRQIRRAQRPIDRVAEAIETRVLLSGSALTAPAAAAPLPLPFPAADTFRLHSNPSATRKIYLNFEGSSLQGTVYNDFFVQQSINIPAFNFETPSTSNPAVLPGLTNAEVERIQRIFQRVAEDFAPFDVDVTTENPGAAGLDQESAGDTSYGFQVLIGGRSLGLIRDTETPTLPRPDGLRNFGQFGVTDANVGIVFASSQELTNQEKPVAEAISKVVGFSLGLDTRGTISPPATNYAGAGTGDTGWAPIMGNGALRNLTQWSQGEYEFSDNSIDDLATITSNGLPFRADDRGNAFNAATPINTPSPGGAISLGGIISTRTDQDVFRVLLVNGAYNLTATPAERGPNLDIRMDLLDSSGTVIATSNPIDSLSASLSGVITTPGFYYIRIDGVGRAATAGNPGYSDYGSLGQYTITGTLPQSTNLIPNAPANQEFFVNENAPDGFVVGQFVASDPNPGQTLTYQILGGNQLAGFAIDPVTGLIRVANSAVLNFEANPIFTLQVAAIDSGTPTLSVTVPVVIRLRDVNEAPVIPPRVFSVNLPTTNGTNVGAVQATDPDPIQTLTYAIVGGNTGGAFSIVPTSGVIRVAKASNVVPGTYNLQVRATDNGALQSPAAPGPLTPLSTIRTVQVVVVQNSAPVVQNSAVQLREFSFAGTFVAQIQATDPDVGQSLIYEVTNQPASTPFRINTQTGLLTVFNPAALNMAVNPVIVVNVRVTDTGSPARWTDATITVTLIPGTTPLPSLTAGGASASGTATNLIAMPSLRRSRGSAWSFDLQ